MTTAIDGHITIDDKGIARIDGTRHRVVDLVLDRRAYGWDADQMHEQFPDLTLAEIHAAFCYYYDHQSELDAEIERADQETEAMRAAAEDTPFQKRMRAEGRIP